MELDVKKEDLRSVQANIRVIEQGGQVEDESLALKNSKDNIQNTIDSLLQKKKQLTNTLKRAEK